MKKHFPLFLSIFTLAALLLAGVGFAWLRHQLENTAFTPVSRDSQATKTRITIGGTSITPTLSLTDGHRNRIYEQKQSHQQQIGLRQPWPL